VVDPHGDPVCLLTPGVLGQDPLAVKEGFGVLPPDLVERGQPQQNVQVHLFPTVAPPPAPVVLWGIGVFGG